MSRPPLLDLVNVTVEVDGKTVCREVSLAIGEGETHILLGPNGSGKSSLLNAIMGTGPGAVVDGTVTFDGVDVTDADVTERARLGLGISAQHPPALPGVTVRRLAHAMGADDRLAEATEALELDRMIPRDVNVGFSGGEVKRWEVCKLLLQQPLLSLFDEPESGVDLEHVAVVGRAVGRLLATPTPTGRARSALMITHTGFVLDHVTPTRGHLMVDGRLVADGDAREMFDAIRRDGFAA
ncbi:MAG: ATP-binding cassette domain-containing protein [Gordonia sp. (in: high G+C Gram-positive bacteria)]|uniref:ATP-binding cassette domain-containing protein n=1 Tax=Gordonia sp. (in: high G+C Gram-positive bacteria) TaxID=84139 RepID=UPI0039E5A5C0